MKPLPVQFFRFENLSLNPGLMHFVTTRQGGVSQGNYSSLNLGLHTADEPGYVIRNREILAESLALDPSKFVWSNQVHEEKVEVVNTGRGFYCSNDALESCDAMVSNTEGLCVVVMVADCVPVLLFDPIRRVVGVAHAGWRGTVKRIVANTVEVMKTVFGCDPKDIIAGIGPSIGPCCYEVGKDVKETVSAQNYNTPGYIRNLNGKWYFDLWAANRNQLVESGLLAEQIELAQVCTMCNCKTFFSSRAEKGITGRFVAGISLQT